MYLKSKLERLAELRETYQTALKRDAQAALDEFFWEYFKKVTEAVFVRIFLSHITSGGEEPDITNLEAVTYFVSGLKYEHEEYQFPDTWDDNKTDVELKRIDASCLGDIENLSAVLSEHLDVLNHLFNFHGEQEVVVTPYTSGLRYEVRPAGRFYERKMV